MAQSVKCPTLDFSSGHDPTARGMEPCVNTESALDSAEASGDSLSLSLSLSAPPHLWALVLSLSENKQTFKNILFKKKRKENGLRKGRPHATILCSETDSRTHRTKDTTHRSISPAPSLEDVTPGSEAMK